MATERKMSDAHKKKIWQAILVAMFILEIILIVLGVRSLIKEHEGIDFYQAFSFVAIAIWIYIAYLKQRNIDISHLVVDEKIKTHSLVENLKDGVILTDWNNTILLANSAAGRITGCDGIELLGRNLTQEVGAEAREMFESGQDGIIETRINSSSKQINLNILTLHGQSGGENCKLVYVNEPSSGTGVATKESANIIQDSERCANLFLELAGRLAECPASGNMDNHARLVLRAMTHGAAMMQPVIMKKSAQSGDAGRALFAALTEVKALAESVGITIDAGGFNETLMVGTDDETLLWVFRQFLCEALLNTDPASGPVIVRMNTMGSDIEVTVFDRGPAVSADSISDLFVSPYSGVKNSDGSTLRGEGGGLCSVMALADTLGGTVIAESPPQGGLRVTMHLPVV